jgi:GGDEF domain-containing protein
MSPWNQSSSSASEEEALTPERRALGLLLEGAAVHQVQVDPALHRHFRSAILRDSIRLSEPQSEADLLILVGALLCEFESYRSESEKAIGARQSQWRQLASMLLHFLAPLCELDPESVVWKSIASELAAAETQEQIETLRTSLQKYLTVSQKECDERSAEGEEEQDRSVANDNAAGLRGGGAAIEHLRAMIANSRPGYVGLFRLNCLDVVGERFGDEGIQDCLMAVSAFLIEHLRIEDSVYHWSESSLVAICDRKVREEILSAELNRILSRNRDFTIQIGDRTIMLRIPIVLELYPVSDFQTAEDLQSLSITHHRSERFLPEKPPVKPNPRPHA